MRIIRGRVCYVETPEIDIFHARMFRGWQSRKEPSEIRVNVSRNIPVRRPGLDLIITDEVREDFLSCKGVLLSECKVTGVLDIPFAEGDFYHWDDKILKRYTCHPEKLYTRPEFLKPAPQGFRLHKVICRNLKDIALDEPGDGLVWLDSEDDETMGGPRYFSQSMWREAHFFYYRGSHVLHDSVFEKLGKYFPEPYFITKHVAE